MPLQGFSDELKDFLIDIACRFYGGMSYARDGDDVVDLKRFNDLDLIDNFTRGSLSDALQGEIDGTTFRWVEAVTEYSSRSASSSSSSTTRTVFTGCLLAVTVSDPFSGEVRISSRRFAPETNRVAIDHPTFHGTFKVIADDEAEARRLVTHDFADKMLAIAGHYGSGRVMGAFQGGEFLLSIETDIDRFEQVSADVPPEEIPVVMHHILGDIQQVRELVGTIVH